MALPSRRFDGTNFFRDVRSKMNQERGLFAGKDGDLKYAVIDCLLYRFELFLRPASQKFTTSGQSLPPAARVLVNGQVFASYNYTGPGAVKWEGEIIDDGTTRKGKPQSKPDHRFWGREDSISEWRHHVAQGDPSGYQTTLFEAMGSLLPLMQGGVRFGTKVSRSGTTVTQKYSPSIANWINKEPPDVGKTAVGIHRATGSFFVIVQEDGASPGVGVKDLIDRLDRTGVDDAVLCDGSNSSTLIIDGTLHCSPAFYKDNSIPTGVSFRLQDITLNGGLLNIGADTTASGFPIPVGSQLSGAAATIRAKSGGGLELEITTLGADQHNPDHNTADFVSHGEISFPYKLDSADTDLTQGVSFTRLGAPPSLKMRVNLKADRTQGQPDTLRGDYQLNTSTGQITGRIAFPLQ